MGRRQQNIGLRGSEGTSAISTYNKFPVPIWTNFGSVLGAVWQVLGQVGRSCGHVGRSWGPVSKSWVTLVGLAVKLAGLGATCRVGKVVFKTLKSLEVPGNLGLGMEI